MLINNQLFDRNILALSTKNPELSSLTGRTRPSSQLKIITSRSGQKIPVIQQKGRDYLLHSRFDPMREALRLQENHPGSGYYIVFGIGGGYHIEALLKRRDISDILIIDRDISLFRALLEELDLRKIFLDTRVQILVDPQAADLQNYLLSHYHPAVMGNLHTLNLAARTNLDKEAFQGDAKTIRTLTSELADDYTVQASFGKRWFINSLNNLPRAAASTVSLTPQRRCLVAGAGPSLEDQFPEIKDRIQRGYHLISTDTALPALLAHDIMPHLVITIDCQQVSYHHFLQGLPPEIPLVLDLASPPTIASLTPKTLYFASTHPFSLYMNSHFRRFPSIDTSGGNVSHAAVSLASLLGAREIRLYGADFSYPEGKMYSRGTYVYPYFRSRESRIQPLESQMIHFLFRNENMIRTEESFGYRYTTKPMISYKKRLEDSLSDLTSLVIPATGKGEPLILPAPRERYEELTFRQMVSAGSSRMGWQEFLTDYRRELIALPQAAQPLGRYFASLSLHHRDLWTTLFPAAAHFRQRSLVSSPGSIPILEEARLWSIEMTGRMLN